MGQIGKRSARALPIGSRHADRGHVLPIGVRLADPSARDDRDPSVSLSGEFLGGRLSGLGLHQRGMQLRELRRREDGKQCIQSGRSHRWAEPKQIDYTHTLSRAAGSARQRDRREYSTSKRWL